MQQPFYREDVLYNREGHSRLVLQTSGQALAKKTIFPETRTCQPIQDGLDWNRQIGELGNILICVNFFPEVGRHLPPGLLPP